MKFLPFYKGTLGCNNPDEVFQYFIANLKDTIARWDYFVNWTKVNKGLRKVEIDLNLLNFLVGKDNIEEEALRLLKEHPHVIQTVPILLACRPKSGKNSFRILQEYQAGTFVYDEYNFKKSAGLTAAKAVEFMASSGFLEQLKSKNVKSLVDYVFGVEVGLDSNGRKNRSGSAMEEIVEFYVAEICKRSGYDYMTQATAPKIKEKWGKKITVEKSSRKIDFAINTPQRLFLIEVNFYGGGGSKLKSTAGEYKSDFKRWKADGHEFVWITDGAGWHTAHLPLRETFDDTDYILNLDMLERGLLKSMLCGKQ